MVEKVPSGEQVQELLNSIKEIDVKKSFFYIIPKEIYKEIYDVNYHFLDDPNDPWRKEFVMNFYYKGQKLFIALRIWSYNDPKMLEEFRLRFIETIQIIDKKVSSGEWINFHPKNKGYII